MSLSNPTTPEQSDDLLNLLDSEAQEILNIALQEAQRINHFWVGVEHLFMGLSGQPGGLTVKLLKHLRIDPRYLQGYIRVTAGIGDPRYKIPPGPPLEKGRMIITPRLLDILKRARSESQKQGKQTISSEQLLLAILEEGESIPMRIFCKMGLDPSQLLELARKEEGLPEIEEVFPSIPEPVGIPQEGKNPPLPPSTSLRPGSSRWKSSGPSQADSGLTGKPTPTPTLDRYSQNLTQLAREGKLHPAIGRKEILRQIARILTEREANNPLLIGEAGVGKTAIVEGFAYRLAGGKVIPQLQDKRIVELQLPNLVSGVKHRGELEERVSRILQEVKADPELIVFIDKIHTIMGGGIGSSKELADYLKPALVRGEFPCIGSTTLAEYQKYIERDAALARRFERIDVEEPDLETCKEILRGVQILLEEHYNVKIHFSAIEAAVEFSARFVPQEKLPAKAVKLLEKACSLIKIKSLTSGEEDMATRRFLMVNENTIRQVLSEKTGIPLNHLILDE